MPVLTTNAARPSEAPARRFGGKSHAPRAATEVTPARRFLPTRIWTAKAVRLARSRAGVSLLGEVREYTTTTATTTNKYATGWPTVLGPTKSTPLKSAAEIAAVREAVSDGDVLRARMAAVLANGKRLGHNRPSKFGPKALYRIEDGLYETHVETHDKVMRDLGYDLTVLPDGTREWMHCFGPGCEHPSHQGKRPAKATSTDVVPLAGRFELNAADRDRPLREIVLPGRSPLAPVFSHPSVWCNPLAFAVDKKGIVTPPADRAGEPFYAIEQWD